MPSPWRMTRACHFQDRHEMVVVGWGGVKSSIGPTADGVLAWPGFLTARPPRLLPLPRQPRS